MDLSKFLLAPMAAVVACLFVSCGPVYHGPPHDPATTATLRCTKEKLSFYSNRGYWVKSIDGKRVDYTWKAADAEIVVPAGKHEMVLTGNFDLGLHKPAGHWEPTAVTADLKAGRSYVVRGYFNYPTERRAQIWIEDTASGKPVSEKLSLPCIFLVPGPTPVFLPVG